MDDDIVEDNGGGDEYSEDDNVSTNTTTSDEEGIFDVPSSIPDEDSRTYVLLKGRFTVEANKDPLTQVQTLTARATGELLAIGVNALNIKSTTEQSFLSWAQNWYDTDSNFQLKKERARQDAVDQIASLEKINAGQVIANYAEAKTFVYGKMVDEIKRDLAARDKFWTQRSRGSRRRYVNRARKVILKRNRVIKLIERFPNLQGYIDRLKHPDFLL